MCRLVRRHGKKKRGNDIREPERFKSSKTRRVINLEFLEPNKAREMMYTWEYFQMRSNASNNIGRLLFNLNFSPKDESEIILCSYVYILPVINKLHSGLTGPRCMYVRGTNPLLFVRFSI